MSLTVLDCLILLIWEVVEVSSGSSERQRSEPKCWLNFDDVAHCRGAESFNAFVEQFLSKRALRKFGHRSCLNIRGHIRFISGT